MVALDAETARLCAETPGPSGDFMFGLPVTISQHLPINPSDEDNIVRSVRHGLADVLAWLGEDVGPKPGDSCHAIRTPDRIHVSKAFFDEMKRLMPIPRKVGPSSAMAERGRRGGESPDRIVGHGDGGRGRPDSQ